MKIDWTFPFSIKSGNIKEHWSETSRRNKTFGLCFNSKWAMEPIKIKPPCNVIILRLYERSKKQKAYDTDNFITGCKGIRDCLANMLVPGLAPGQADHAKHGITWQYDQMSANMKGTRIIIQNDTDDHT